MSQITTDRIICENLCNLWLLVFFMNNGPEAELEEIHLFHLQKNYFIFADQS